MAGPTRPGRGGLYSYDRLENLFRLGFQNADQIIPELQHLAVGDQVWLDPRDSATPLCYQVLDLQPPQALVLGPTATARRPWTRPALAHLDLRAARPRTGRTRMIVGIRSDFKSTRLGLLANRYGLEPVHFAMEVRCCWASSSAPNEPPPL